MLRRVFGNYKRISNDQPLANAVIRFSTSVNDYDVLSSYPKDYVDVTTDASGNLPDDFNLWCNADGQDNSTYLVREPDGYQWRFVLPYGNGAPISIQLLRAAGNEFTSNEPISSFLDAKVDKVLGIAGEFAVFDEFGQIGKSETASLRDSQIPASLIRNSDPRLTDARTPKRFVYLQTVEAAQWIVNHNLGVNPNCEVRGIAGNVVDAEIQHFTENQLRVYFAVPQRGSIVCI